jgi:hypothetical protein
LAVKTTSQAGGAAARARSVSSQQTRPPPRSAVDCHHELRGDDDRRPRPIAAGDRRHEVARPSRGAAAFGDEPHHRSPIGGGEHRLAHLAGDVDRRRPVGMAKPLGIQQPHARPGALAKDRETAMGMIAAQPFVIRGMDKSGRQLGDGDSRLAPDRAERAGNAISGGDGGVEDRHTGEAGAGDLQIDRKRLEAIERKLLITGCDAEIGGLMPKPVGARFVARRRSAVEALRIPCPQPRVRAGLVIRHSLSSLSYPAGLRHSPVRANAGSS